MFIANGINTMIIYYIVYVWTKRVSLRVPINYFQKEMGLLTEIQDFFSKYNDII